jgi:hypothetical protein
MLSPPSPLATVLIRGQASATSTDRESSATAYRQTTCLWAQTEVQEQMDAAVAAVTNGVDFWALFATCLKDEYDEHPIVKRIPGTRALQYRWIISDKLLLQLKSNTDNMPVDQLEIPGMTEQLGGPIEWIALTWEHNQVERFEPAFVQNHQGKEVWRVPVASIVEPAAETIKPATPRSTVSSARKPAAEAEQSS